MPKGAGCMKKKMASCCREFGWQELSAEQVKDMSEAELKGMVESGAWRRVKEEWSKELEKPKLSLMKKMIEYCEKSSCAGQREKGGLC